MTLVQFKILYYLFGNAYSTVCAFRGRHVTTLCDFFFFYVPSCARRCFPAAFLKLICISVVVDFISFRFILISFSLRFHRYSFLI